MSPSPSAVVKLIAELNNYWNTL